MVHYKVVKNFVANLYVAEFMDRYSASIGFFSEQATEETENRLVTIQKNFCVVDYNHKHYLLKKYFNFKLFLNFLSIVF